MVNHIPIIGIAGSAGSGKDTAAAWIANVYHGTVVAQADPIKRFVKDVFAFPEELLWGSSELRNIPEATLENKISTITKSFNEYAPDWIEEIFPEQDFDDTLENLENHFKDIRSKIVEGPVSPRYILQILGTDFARSIQPDVWNRYALDVCTALLEGNLEYNRAEGVFDSKINHNFIIISDIRFRNEIINLRSLTAPVLKINRKVDKVPGNHVSETELEQIPNHFFSEVIDNNSGLEELYWKLNSTVYDCYFK